jgi:hypothetical protein
MPRKTKITIRKGTEQEWNFVNPILGLGEPGYETTNNILKIGDGIKTWTELGVQSICSPIRLDSDGDFLNNVSLRSSEIDFTNSGYLDIFSVPYGCMFFINSIEILTTSLESKGEPPSIKLGDQIDDSCYYKETFIASNNLGSRHIIEDPQEASLEGTTIRLSVGTPSTAIIHKGFCIINGVLFNFHLPPPPTQTPTALV